MYNSSCLEANAQLSLYNIATSIMLLVKFVSDDSGCSNALRLTERPMHNEWSLDVRTESPKLLLTDCVPPVAALSGHDARTSCQHATCPSCMSNSASQQLLQALLTLAQRVSISWGKAQAEQSATLPLRHAQSD